MLIATTVNLDGTVSSFELGDEYLDSLQDTDLTETDFKHFTGQDKLSIFTQEEQKAIYRAAYRDYDEDVMLVVKGLDNALYLTYSDPRTVAGLELLESKGLITPERHQEIIALMTAERHL